jgi:hypothetical protein
MKREEIEQRIRDYTASKEDSKVDIELDNHLNSFIWNKVEKSINPVRKMRWISLMAASILGIILTIGISSFTRKNNEIAYLKAEIENREMEKSSILQELAQVQHEKRLIQDQPPKIDTVYTTNVVYKTVYQTNNTQELYFAHEIDSGAFEAESEAQNLIALSSEERSISNSDSVKVDELSQWEESFDIIIDPTAEILHIKIDFDKVVSTFIGVNKFKNCPLF